MVLVDTLRVPDPRVASSLRWPPWPFSASASSGVLRTEIGAGRFRWRWEGD
jgi:hypothetical protein